MRKGAYNTPAILSGSMLEDCGRRQIGRSSIGLTTGLIQMERVQAVFLALTLESQGKRLLIQQVNGTWIFRELDF
jgi:hypothetical protein